MPPSRAAWLFVALAFIIAVTRPSCVAGSSRRFQNGALNPGAQRELLQLFGKHPVNLGGGSMTFQQAFTADVRIGQPGTTYTLLVDTLGPVTWVGAEKTYVVTSSSKPGACPSGIEYFPNDGQNFAVTESSGSASGTCYKDTVSLSGSLTARNINIGVASSSNGLPQNLDGVLGLWAVPDVGLPDQLFKQGVVPSPTVSLCLASGMDTGGTLFFGNVPTSDLGRSYGVTYTPMVTTANSGPSVATPVDFLSNNASISGAAQALGATTNSWPIDSTQLLTLVPDAVHSLVFSAVQAYSKCPKTTTLEGVPSIDLTSCDPPMNTNSVTAMYARFPTLSIKFQGTIAVARPKSYLIFNTVIDPSSSQINNAVPGIAPAGSNSPSIGQSFMTDNLVVFDNVNNKIGYAPVNCLTLEPLLDVEIGRFTFSP